VYHYGDGGEGQENENANASGSRSERMNGIENDLSESPKESVTSNVTQVSF